MGWPLDSGFARTPTEQYLADAFRFHHVMDVQGAILARTDATLIWALSSYLDDLSAGDRPVDLAAILEESRAATRNSSIRRSSVSMVSATTEIIPAARCYFQLSPA